MTDRSMQTYEPASYLAAIFLSLPVVGIMWGIVIYMVTGVTGKSIHPYFHTVSCAGLYLIIFGWSLFGSFKASETVYRLCRFGAMLSLLLPVAAAITSLVWIMGAADRPAEFFNGLSVLELPVYAAGISILLILIFLTGSYLAARDMEGIPF